MEGTWFLVWDEGSEQWVRIAWCANTDQFELDWLTYLLDQQDEA